MMKSKYVLISVFLWSVTSISIAVAQSDSSSLGSSQSLFENLLELLRIIVSWPFIFFFLALIFRKAISEALNKISERLYEFRYKDIILNLKDTVKEQQEKINSQQEIINNLVIYSMSYSIFNHLKSIYYRTKTNEEYLYYNNEAMRREMYYLRDNGFIRRIDYKSLDFDNSLHEKDLIKIVELTPIGNFFVELRDKK